MMAARLGGKGSKSAVCRFFDIYWHNIECASNRIAPILSKSATLRGCVALNHPYHWILGSAHQQLLIVALGR
jgi:hypothetical protein